MRRKYRVPPIDALNDLFNKGEVSRFLAQEFLGVRFPVFPRQDSDILVCFLSEEQTPSIGKIALAVIMFFEKKGYSVDSKIIDAQQQFKASIYQAGQREVTIELSITTNYPFLSCDNLALHLVNNSFASRTLLPEY